MTASPRCLHYADLLMELHWDSLDNISTGNAEIVAFMVAGAVCHAENLAMVTLHRDCHAELLNEVICALQENSTRDLELNQPCPPTFRRMIIMVAIARYRECAINEFGGYQTPCTVSAIEMPINTSESPYLCGIPVISNMISTISKMQKKLASLLKNSMNSKEGK